MISFTNIKPDITVAQVVGLGPVLADLFHSFGIFTITAAEQASLHRAVIAGMALFGADAAIRIGRNLSPAESTKAHFAGVAALAAAEAPVADVVAVADTAQAKVAAPPVEGPSMPDAGAMVEVDTPPAPAA